MILSETKMTTRTVNALNKKKIYTVNDLATYFPRKYLDYRKTLALSKAVGGDCAIAGYLEYYEKKNDSGKSIITASMIEETSGERVKIQWYGQSYQLNSIKNFARKEIVVCGKVTKHPVYGYGISNPYGYYLKELYAGKIIPVYTKIKNISDNMLKKWIDESIELLSDPIPEEIISRTGLPEYKKALYTLHHPKSMEELEKAQKRIIFNDMLYFTTRLKQQHTTSENNSLFRIQKTILTKQYLDMLPYEFTKDQKNTFYEIKKQMGTGKRVNALVQGDVGCGKTAVAFAAMFLMADAGYQSVIMAPTGILAKQHYDELCRYAEPMGLKAAYLSAELQGKKKDAVLCSIENGEAAFIVGTHSVFSEKVKYHNLGLTVTDEEHRFGVRQRKELEKKAEAGVHIISMSATPIPRTIADVMYGEDKMLMTIKTMPNGRVPVQTAINNSDTSIFAFIEKQISEGRQCYVVCPLIEEIDADDEKKSVMQGVESVEETEIKYREYFDDKNIKVGVVTGAMDKEETDNILSQFKENAIQILVATTVIEVGINVPNANVIVINNAERFGLAQLHQLRGRVCRGNYKSYCILKSAEKGNERLKTMVETTDGFEIAQADLRQRGMGNLIGTAQSGNNHFMELVIAMPNLFNHVKNYAEMLLTKHIEEPLIGLYEENNRINAEE